MIFVFVDLKNRPYDQLLDFCFANYKHNMNTISALLQILY